MNSRVLSILVKAGVQYRVRKHTDCALPIRSPQDFAACLGYDLGRVTKTLFCRSTKRDQFALAVSPMTGMVDFSVIAQALGSPRFEVADKLDLESKLDYPPQGVSPLGADEYPVFIDDSLMSHRTILIGSGTTGVEIELDPFVLVQLCGAQVKCLRR